VLHRKQSEGILCISQSAHAWVSGQIARHWGGGDFPGLSEEVCLAAELHDIGFLQWERSPVLNPATGLPYTFMEMPTREHLDIWTTGIQQMLRLGRYPALLVSMHFAFIRRTYKAGTEADRKLAQEWLDAQDALQTTLKTSLSNDFHYGPLLGEKAIRRDQQMVSAADWLSLLLCHGLKEEKSVPDVPAVNGTATLQLKPLDLTGSKVSIHPWPFRTDRVSLLVEGRHLLRTYQDQQEMREAIRSAAPLMVPIELVPG
jgi:hypothetical protein